MPQMYNKNVSYPERLHQAYYLISQAYGFSMSDQHTNLRCCAVIVARQEHDSPATMYGRIFVRDGSN